MRLPYWNCSNASSCARPPRNSRMIAGGSLSTTKSDALKFAMALPLASSAGQSRLTKTGTCERGMRTGPRRTAMCDFGIPIRRNCGCAQIQVSAIRAGVAVFSASERTISPAACSSARSFGDQGSLEIVTCVFLPSVTRSWPIKTGSRFAKSSGESMSMAGTCPAASGSMRSSTAMSCGENRKVSPFGKALSGVRPRCHFASNTSMIFPRARD